MWIIRFWFENAWHETKPLTSLQMKIAGETLVKNGIIPMYRLV